MHSDLRTALLIALLSLAGYAAVYGETEPARLVSESGDVSVTTAARLTVDEVGAAVAAGASLGRLLRVVATHNPDPEVTVEVLRAGAPIDGRDAHGWTALMYATAFNRHAEVADALLAAGADRRASGDYEPLPSARWFSFDTLYDVLADESGGTPLFFMGSPREMDRLIFDIIPWFRTLGLTAVFEDVKLRGGDPALLAAAAYNPNPAMVRTLIDHGSDVNAAPADGMTALMAAAGLNSEPAVVASLLAAGARIHARSDAGLTPLMVAARYNDPGIVAELLAAGANVDARDDQGRTAFLHAAEAADPTSLLALIEAGADVHVRFGKDRATAIMYAVRFNPDASWILDTLVQAGVELDARDRHGRTALMNAAAYGSADPHVVRSLVNLGADPSLETDAGRTALDLMRDNPSLNGSDLYWWLHDRLAGATVDLGRAEVAELAVVDVKAAIADGAPLTRLLLEAACYNGNAAVTQALLDAGAPIDYRTGGWTVLMNAAAVNPNPAVVQALLDAGAELISTNAYRTVPECIHPNPDYRDTIDLVSVLVSEELGETGEFWDFFEGEAAWALFAAAAYSENAAVVQVLIDAGAEVDGRTPYDGVTPLMVAAGLNRNPDVVRTLIAAGADPNARMAGGLYPAYTALMAAAWYNPKPAVLQALLEAGADVHAATRNGWTALLYAVSRNLPQLGDSELPAIVRQLLAAGAEVDARDTWYGTTPLMAAAASQRNPAIVRQLLAAGAEVDARDHGGRTPLMAAGWNPANVRALLAAGASPETRDDDGDTPLHGAAGSPPSLRALLAAGADPRARNDAGETVLITAAERGGAQAIPVLLAAGARLDARDGAGRTALIAAASRGRSEAAEALVAAGADLEARDDAGDTALIAAARRSKTGMVEMLLAAGADPKARNHGGQTALIAAVAGGGERERGWDPFSVDGSSSAAEVVELLLDLGADAALANDDAETAWDLIQDNEELRSTSAYRRLRDLGGAADRDEP